MNSGRMPRRTHHAESRDRRARVWVAKGTPLSVRMVQESKLCAQAGEHGLGPLHTGGGERLTAEQEAAVAIGHGERITGEPVARFEVACQIGAPDSVGGQDWAGGLPRMAKVSALSFLGHQAMTA